MKKRINGKIKKTKKKILAIIVILIFLLYFCLALAVSKRNYLYTESIFKTISSSINSFFINNAYSNNNFSSNVINSKIRYLEKENNSLRNLASIKEKNVDYVSCEIVNRTSKFWFDKVTINAGYNDKVKKNLPVINDKGLIGFITKTGKKVSDVKLLTGINENNMISVFVETENGPIAGMLSGYDEKENLFKISDITKKNDVFSGDEVVLSGYGNEAYKGIYVGKVVREETENYGLSRTLWIESNVNFDDSLFALVPIVKEKK